MPRVWCFLVFQIWKCCPLTEITISSKPKIIIHEINRIDKNIFIDHHLGGETIAWAGGYLISHQNIKDEVYDKILVKENVKHIKHLLYAECLEYPSEVKDRYNNTIAVLDFTQFNTYITIVKMIKDIES